MRIYEDGIYRDLTEEEINAFEETSTNDTNVEPTVEERIYSLESAISDLAIMLMGGMDND